MRILIIESCEKVLKEKVNSSIVHVRNEQHHIILRCQQTIKKSGYNISPFQIVNDGVELKHKLNLIDSDSDMYKTILEIQQSNVKIIKKERKNLLATFKEILS